MNTEKTEKQVPAVKYEDHGDMSIANANEMNVPMNAFLSGPKDNEDGKFHWTAGNFCPRKDVYYAEAYNVSADSREALIELVKFYIAPLYEVAFQNLTNFGENYYWEKQTGPL